MKKTYRQNLLLELDRAQELLMWARQQKRIAAAAHAAPNGQRIADSVWYCQACMIWRSAWETRHIILEQLRNL